MEHENVALVQDALRALADIEVSRFHVTNREVGAPNYSFQYVYLFENKGEAPHWVVPLYRMKRGVQFNMKVSDGNGHALIYMDSVFCRAVAVERALVLYDSLLQFFSRHEGKLLFSDEDIRKALIGPTVSPPELQASTEALSDLIENVRALLDSIPRPYVDAAENGGAFYDSLDDVGRSVIHETRHLFQVTTALLEWLNLHAQEYVPFVLLPSPIMPRASPEGRHLTLVKHEVQGVPTYLEVEQESVLNKIATFPLKAAASAIDFLIVVILALWGVRITTTTFPMNTQARSHHLKYQLADGMRRLAVLPIGILPWEFSKHNAGGHWAKHDDRSEYLYRQKAQIEKYFDEYLANTRHLKKRPEVNLHLIILAWEGAFMLLISLGAVIFALLWSWSLNEAEFGSLPYLTIAFSLMGLYAAQAFHKPLLSAPLKWKAAAFVLALGQHYWINQGFAIVSAVMRRATELSV